MKFEPPATLYSPQQLAVVRDEISRYVNWLGHEQVRLTVGEVPNKLEGAPPLSLLTTQTMAAWQGDRPASAQTLTELMTELAGWLDKAPRVSLTLAAPPGDGMKQRLVQWLRQEIHPRALVTFQFNSTLLGGLVVRIGSRIFDLSLRQQILSHRTEFAERLRRV